MAIAGKVAKIVNETTVVINVGAKDGVKDGMRFVIVAEGEEVKDPDTGESLGKWEVVKGRVVASHVQENMAVCEAEPPKREGGLSSRTLSAAMIEVSMAGGHEGKLNVRTGEVSGTPQVGPITVGDRVRSVES
jgi:hypothetical protein